MPAPRLVLFTKFPEAGRAKTRLIPALGAEGAANLHRRLSERCVAAMRDSGLKIEIRSTGADTRAFNDWLGDDLTIIDQGDGDLGTRLARAAAHAPVILLGADTPELSATHLVAAAEALARAPAAIGPAEDGGYWLLGLSTAMPFLFTDMAWSTQTVCAETLRRLAARGLTPIVLDTLADCDRPEDLERWPDLVA